MSQLPCGSLQIALELCTCTASIPIIVCLFKLRGNVNDKYQERMMILLLRVIVHSCNYR